LAYVAYPEGQKEYDESRRQHVESNLDPPKDESGAQQSATPQPTLRQLDPSSRLVAEDQSKDWARHRHSDCDWRQEVHERPGEGTEGGGEGSYDEPLSPAISRIPISHEARVASQPRTTATLVDGKTRFKEGRRCRAQRGEPSGYIPEHSRT
jgi:hypothetical protein